MAEATLAGFRSRFDEFSGTADGAVENALEEAKLIHDLLPLATLYLTAHLLTLNGQTTDGTAAGGEVSSESAGPLKVSYKTQAESGQDAFFTSTSYGQRYLQLERRTPRMVIGATVYG